MNNKGAPSHHDFTEAYNLWVKFIMIACYCIQGYEVFSLQYSFENFKLQYIIFMV